ncbi:uncharacterized protein LOC143366953 isoform X2 [Andrena cerasifolii]|uniref:uncharacterized protein LOC143366953 isoform X2 n=1 Tax=Andrena cerasifolii TaxID=2819439 RepID=UPI0040383935
MDQLLTTLARKYSQDMIDAHSMSKENFYPRMNILFDVIKLLCCLIENRAKQMPNEELFRNVKLPADLTKCITKAGIKVEQRAVDLRKQRSHFVHFQQNAERDWKAWMLKKEKMKENLKRVFTMKMAEFSSKMSTMNPKNQMRKACIEKEIDLFVFYLMTMNNTHCSRENDMRDLRFDSKERYLKQMASEISTVSTKSRGKNYSARLEIVLYTRVFEKEKRQKIIGFVVQLDDEYNDNL